MLSGSTTSDFLGLLREEEKSKLLVEDLKSQLASEYLKSREGSQKSKAILYIQKTLGWFYKIFK